VRTALHVPVDSNYFNSDNGADFTYYVTEKSVLPFFLHLLHETKTRTLVYNGDADPSLSSFRTQAAWFPFLKANGIPITEQWRPWTMDWKTDVRGYVTKFFDESKFAYVTIRGSGHMVPEFRSQASFALMKAWINGEDYPTYNPPSSKKEEL
jgi:serine carboxypeptidase-like clade 1